MKAYLKELSHQLLGTVTDNPDVLEHFATDSSIFQVTPAGVVYPNNTADVRKTVAFIAEKAAAGRPVSIIPRGKGGDAGGGAIGEGVQLVLPSHMNKLLRLERDYVVVQPGMSLRTLQQVLYTHGRYLPPVPTSLDSTTVGGAVSNDDAGAKAYKYGSFRSFVKSLKVVVSDGTVIQTRRISARELNRKKGLDTMEGELYRKLDNILLDHSELIHKRQPRSSRNTAGYALSKVRGRDGSFDLGQIFIGAQGTLGVITEVTLKILPFNPRTTVVVGFFGSLDKAGEAVAKLAPHRPCAIELVDQSLLAFLQEHRPGDIEGIVPDKLPKAMLITEFDDSAQLTQKIRSTRGERVMRRLGATTRISTDPIEQVAIWKIRRDAPSLMALSGQGRKALPFIDDAAVPVVRLAEFIDKTHKLLAKHDLEAAIWGHAGNGHLHLLPFLDLAKRRDVDRLFHLNHEFHEMVIAMGGTISAAHNDGLLRATYMTKLYGEELGELMAATKHAFDPLSIFNPMHKTQATEAYARQHLRDSYNLRHLYEHI
jgi:FAD/FMN-containing dehydrogenase